MSVPRRALLPAPDKEEEEDAATDVESQSPAEEEEEKSVGKVGNGMALSERLSPEKEMALRTLDDVIQEAEESIGNLISKVFRFFKQNL